MKIFKFLVLISIISCWSFTIPKGILKKVTKEIVKTYEIEDFKLDEFIIQPELAKTLPSKFAKDNFFKITTAKEHIGYAYLAKAPSKTADFDYLVLLDKDLIIKKAKVIIYREEYGGEISSKRWLRQFIGKTKEDTVSHRDNIIPISGATISVRSMTNAMNDFLQSLKILHTKQIL